MSNRLRTGHVGRTVWCAGSKVSQMVSRELEKECIIVFDEAHNIDNVCIEVRPSLFTTLSRPLPSCMPLPYLSLFPSVQIETKT